MGIRKDDLESRFHRFNARPSADIEEICRLPPRQFDDIHRRHRKPGPVHHAADVPVKLDVIEVGFRCLHLEGVLLVEITEGSQFGMALERVIVKIHLGVERKDFPAGRDYQRVDLRQGAIHPFVCAAECRQKPDAILERIARQSQSEREGTRLIRLKSDRPIHPFAQDLLRRLRGHLLDLHPAFL